MLGMNRIMLVMRTYLNHDSSVLSIIWNGQIWKLPKIFTTKNIFFCSQFPFFVHHISVFCPFILISSPSSIPFFLTSPLESFPDRLEIRIRNFKQPWHIVGVSKPSSVQDCFLSVLSHRSGMKWREINPKLYSRSRAKCSAKCLAPILDDL